MTAPMHTPQQLWRTEFDKQANEETMAFVIKTVESLARYVETRTRRRDPLTVDDRLNAAIVGTLEGRLTWEPERFDLKTHLIASIETAISHELRHARRFRHVSVDDEARNQDDLDQQITGVLAAERAAPDDDAIDSCYARAMAALRELAAKDRDVLRLLDAFDTGAREKLEVMTFTGMSSRTYHNARMRLVRLAKKVPAEVREAVFQAIG